MATTNGKLDLVGTYEAHLILGVERSRIARWLAENEQGKDKIEEPVARLKSGPVWTRAQIEAKLKQLAVEAKVDPRDKKAFETWALSRSRARADQLDTPLTADELREIIRRPVASRAARR